MQHAPDQFTELVFVSKTRYGAQLVRSWLLQAKIETVIGAREDDQNNPEFRRAASHDVYCASQDQAAATQVLDQLELGLHKIYPQDRVLLFPDWDDEDLLTEMIEVMHDEPAVSIAAYAELLKRGKAPSQAEIEGYLRGFEAQWLVLETPLKTTLLHYLLALLCPPWGFYKGAAMIISGKRQQRNQVQWGTHHADISIGAVTLLVAGFGAFTMISVVMILMMKR
jgi:hypothetical protein